MDTDFVILQGAAVLIFAACMVYAAVSDLRTFEIPNWVLIVVLALFPITVLAGPIPLSSILPNVITGLSVFAVGFALFAFGYFGAGDVKLLAVIALWVGWPLLITYLTIVVLAGGVLSLFLIVFRRFPLYRGIAAIRWIAQMYERKKDVPYAVPIALTAFCFLPRMPLIAELFPS